MMHLLCGELGVGTWNSWNTAQLFTCQKCACFEVRIPPKIGLEPFGRIGIGVGELIASILILLNPTKILGALLAIGLMSGAIFFHLTVLGVVVMNDGGLLLTYAALVWIASSTVVILHRNELTMMLTQIRNLIKPDKSKSL